MTPSRAGAPTPSTRGLALATVLVLAWLISLIWLLRLDVRLLPAWQLAAAILLRMQLQTGLFIVGHDAMHRLLWPGRHRLNDRLGAIALACYAALPYRSCSVRHLHHHRRNATADDPDFLCDQRLGPLVWYRQFMSGYLSPSQMGWLLSGWGLLALSVGINRPWGLCNVLLFCTLPLLLSSVQLFVFGTYLPHRHQRDPQRRAHPISLNLPEWLSLMACFHFGYHREHHDQPGVAWYDLPSVHRLSTGATVQGLSR